jgi:hypothetical protein
VVCHHRFCSFSIVGLLEGSRARRLTLPPPMDLESLGVVLLSMRIAEFQRGEEHLLRITLERQYFLPQMHPIMLLDILCSLMVAILSGENLEIEFIRCSSLGNWETKRKIITLAHLATAVPWQ